MKKDLLIDFFLSAAGGAAIWALSPAIVGKPEPWDAESLYYVLALLAVGLLLGVVRPRRFWIHYPGVLFGQLIYRYAPGRAKRWRVVRGRRAVRGVFCHAPARAVEPVWASAVPRRGALDRRAAEAGRAQRDPEHCAETEGARGTRKSRRAY